jgi:ABC-type multidrug transport system fused ATPase/permease subunit
VALRVTNGDSTASDFVIFVAYLVQLYEPLNMLASIYRSINTALVDTEKLLKLLNEPVGINDKPNAPDLVVTNGEIEFGSLTPLVSNSYVTDPFGAFTQTTSASRTTIVFPLWTRSVSRSPRVRQLLSSAALDLGSPPSSGSFTDSTISGRVKEGF